MSGPPDYYSMMQALTARMRDGDFEPGEAPEIDDMPGYFVDGLSSRRYLKLRPNQGAPILDKDCKFHISVAAEDVPRAWNIVVDALLADGPGHRAMVATPETAKNMANPSHEQAGKTMTFYTSQAASPAQYQTLLCRIERRLEEAGIKPGESVSGDRAVQDSAYLSYRYDKNPDGHYISSDLLAILPESQRYNPYDRPDPYAGFNMATAKELAAIREAAWAGVSMRGGSEARYADLKSMTPQQQAALESALVRHGIAYDVKDTSLGGGGTVIAVQGDDLFRLCAVISGAQLAPEFNRGVAGGADRHLAAIRDTLWIDVTVRGGGGFARYADLRLMSPERQTALESALVHHGIDYDFKNTSLWGGATVIAVQGDNLFRMVKAIEDAGKPAESPSVVEQRPAGQPISFSSAGRPSGS